MADDRKPADDGKRETAPPKQEPPPKPERPKPDTMRSFHGSDDQIRARRDHD